MILKAENIFKYFKSGEDKLTVLDGLNLEVNKGDYVALLGASGSGKSTLLHILGSIDLPNSGKVNITIDQKSYEITSLNQSKLPGFRNKHIGFVFQFHHLLPEFNALENIILPALIAGDSKKNAIDKAKELSGFVGISSRLKHRPAQMSGGEQQRAAIARALINSPSILLADEPTGNLDDDNSNRVMQLFDSIRDQFGVTIIFATHSKQLANRAGIRYNLANGRISVVR